MPSLGDILSGLSYAADTPGALMRGGIGNIIDLLTGEDKQHGWRASTRDLLEQRGGFAPNEDGLDTGDVLGFVGDTVLDPLNLVGGGLLKRLLGSASKAKATNRGIEAANAERMAVNRATAMSPRGVKAEQQIPFRELAEADKPIRGYLPDLTNERIAGSRRMVVTPDEQDARLLYDKIANGKLTPRNDLEDAVARGSMNPREFEYHFNKKSDLLTKGPHYHDSKLPADVQVQYTYNYPFDAPGVPPVVEMDAFKGLNAGHALSRAAANAGKGTEVRLIRTLPKPLSLEEAFDTAISKGNDFDNFTSVEDALKLAERESNRNYIIRELGIPAPKWPTLANPQTEKAFLPSDRFEQLASAAQRESSRVNRLQPDPVNYVPMLDLDDVPTLKSLIGLLSASNSAKYGDDIYDQFSN